MRRILLPTIILGMTSLASVASAQNYLQTQSYEGPGIIVNLDVLGHGGSAPYPSASIQPPVQMVPLAPPQAPLVLRPPVQQPVQTARAPMPAPIVAAPVASEYQETVQPEKNILTPEPFAAREVAAMAPPAPIVPVPVAPKAIMPTPVVKTPSPVAVANTAPVNPARQLLAQAREEALSDEAEAPRQVVASNIAPQPLEALEAPAAGNAATVATKPVKEFAPALPPPVTQAAIAQEEMKVASLTPSAVPALVAASPAAAAQNAMRIDDFEAYRLVFDGQSDVINAAEKPALDKIISQMKADPAIRLQIRAYANGTPDTTAQARRTSLARALAVRTYLLNNGVTAPRLDVRALGIGSTAMGDTASRGSTPADRADLVLVR